MFGSANKSVDMPGAEEQTNAIARDFATDSDLEKARAAVAALDTANPGQWLIFMTENAVADAARDPAQTQALVRLTLALGYQESSIVGYARANGLADTAGVLTGSKAAADAATVAAAMAAPVPDAQPVAAAASAVAAPAVVAPAGAETAAAPLSAAIAPTSAETSLLATGPAASNPVAEPTAAPALATSNELINLRLGPGLDYGLAGSLAPAETAAIVGKNSSGEWWQVRTNSGASAWVYGQLVTASGSAESVPVVTDIPPAPTLAPAPVAEVAAPDAAPAEPAATAPAADPAPAAPAASPSDQPTFTMVEHRLWSKEENGTCKGQHLLRIIVVDANNNPLNGVTLQGIYTGAILVTGSQGKGEGRIEYDLYGTGEGFRVLKDVDGRDAISDNAEGFTTKSLDIDQATLIGAGYCTNDADCQQFFNSYGCTGHHSWEAKFQRNF